MGVLNIKADIRKVTYAITMTTIAKWEDAWFLILVCIGWYDFKMVHEFSVSTTNMLCIIYQYTWYVLVYSVTHTSSRIKIKTMGAW